ncbi:MAG: ATPase [Lewinellaceae bacterium]|nr:ATPase [Lewinellaceae bacterium]
MNNIQITKASGESADFEPAKLEQSLRRAGAGQHQAETITRAIEAQLREGMTTGEIYRMAKRMLRKEARHTAARYSLKRALLDFGPSGFPFEQYIAQLLKADGYSVEHGLLRQGHCILHEIDVLAQMDSHVVVGECKFHNRQNLVCDVKVPLYIHSRFRDLKAGFLSAPTWNGHNIESWIFTNTRFTDDASQYGQCAGMHLVSWNWPPNGSLRDWVDRSGLHPVTCLTTLTRREKDLLLEKKVVLVRELLANRQLLKTMRVATGRIPRIIEEAELVCGV